MRWKLYYADGTTFSSEDGVWSDAPYRGVVVLSTEDPNVGRELDHGARGEFFAWWPDATKPWGHDRVGILDYLAATGRPTSLLLADLSLDDWRAAGVKIGRSLDNHLFREILLAAMDDPFLPAKSADSTREVQ